MRNLIIPASASYLALSDSVVDSVNSVVLTTANIPITTHNPIIETLIKGAISLFSSFITAWLLGRLNKNKKTI
jgi:hypothetical protein